MFSKYFCENYFTFFTSHNEEAMYELGPADHLSTSYFSFLCLSHPWMSDCLCVLPFPSFLFAAWLLLSLTSLWGVSLWWCSFDQGTLGLERCPAVLTALQRRVGQGSEVVTYSPSIKKLVPLLEWNPGTPIPITEFFLQQHLTPPQRFPPLFNCYSPSTPFSVTPFLAFLFGFQDVTWAWFSFCLPIYFSVSFLDALFSSSGVLDGSIVLGCYFLLSAIPEVGCLFLGFWLSAPCQMLPRLSPRFSSGAPVRSPKHLTSQVLPQVPRCLKCAVEEWLSVWFCLVP